MAYGVNIHQQQGTISAGAALSGPVNFGADELVGIAMPAAWTAAGLTFQVSADGVSWLEFYTSAGAEVTYTVAAGQFIAVDPTLWRGINSIQFRSGTAGVPVNQVAAATLTFITRTPAF